MKPKDNFKNITLPYVRTVKPTLLSDEIESISDEEMGRRITYMRRKLLDNVFRYNGKWSNKTVSYTHLTLPTKRIV